MKAYLIVTGVIFGLLAAMHVYIALTELNKLTSEPGQFATMAGMGLFAGGLTVWAWRLLVRARS